MYMLMYTRRGTPMPAALDLPPDLLAAVQEENSAFLKDAAAYESQASVLGRG